MKTTKNYGLIKPEPAEYYDVEQFNQNMDVIDEKIKEIDKNNVPNVSTNNQKPTYTAATTLKKLVSGESLSIAFGKIAKAVNELIVHIENTKKMQKAVITVRGAESSQELPESMQTKIVLDKNHTFVNRSGYKYDGTTDSFSISDDGGVICPYTGVVLVSGSVYMSGYSGTEMNKRCFIRQKKHSISGSCEEVEVCYQSIRDMGASGGISSGTMAIEVQDGDMLYLYAQCSVKTTCNPAHTATYLSATYLITG